MANSLRKDLIRLAKSNPKLRSEILPLLKQGSGWTGIDAAYAALTFASGELLSQGDHEEATQATRIKQRLLRGGSVDRASAAKLAKEMYRRYHVEDPFMADMPGPDDDRWNRGASSKTGSPVALDVVGLDVRAAKSGMGAMLYFIDSAKNHSKFYEMMIVSEGGGFKLMRAWGALTDKGSAGRIDRKDMHFDNMGQAQRGLSKLYTAKTRKGYVDAFGPKHKTPDGKRLPSGRYPVGLTRGVGFGWGTQEMAWCIPALRSIAELLSGAQKSLGRMQFGDASDTLNAVARIAEKQLGRENSSMAAKIRDNIAHMQGRAAKLLAGEIDGGAIRNWKVALSRLISYIDKQLSVCH